ncbi:glycosyltransferase [Ferruginibacter sp.]
MTGLSIILVNYKVPLVALDCLRTLFPLPPEMEVIVVDNHSGDDSRDLILSRFPQVQWVQMDYNSGFARGNNAGIHAAKGNVVLLLNSDTLNQDNAIVRCYQQFKDSAYVACGVQLLNADGSPQISGNFFMKGGLNHLMSLPYTGRLIRAVGLLLKVKKQM